LTPDDIRELFAAFGTVQVRRMFGGAGIYAEETMFALVHDRVIYLKADGHNAPAFERENLAPFTYTTRHGKRGVMSYRRMPDRLYDDPDELAAWAREALAAARRGSGRRGATRKGSPTGKVAAQTGRMGTDRPLGSSARSKGKRANRGRA
jgi:DNA transformation protein and related proteins